MSGVLGPVIGWREVFVLVSLPSLVFSVFLYTFVDEPVREKVADTTDADLER